MLRQSSFFWPATPPSQGNTASIIPYTVSNLSFLHVDSTMVWLIYIYILSATPWCAVSLLNLHEDVRCKPASWVPVGWIPKYDPKLAVGRSTRGMTSHASRKVDLFHQCFRVLLQELVEQEGLMDITWGDGITRTSFVRLGGFIGDQQEADRVACQAGTCHRCHSSREDFWRPKGWRARKPRGR